MSDMFWSFVVILAFGGLFFWAWLIAQLIFRIPRLFEILSFLVKKFYLYWAHLKPLSSSSMFQDNTNQAKGNCEASEYTSHPENRLNCLKQVYGRCKCILIWISLRQSMGYHGGIKNYRNNPYTRTKNNTTHMVNNLVNCETQGVSQHSEANVSQDEEPCQPKANRTHRNKVTSSVFADRHWFR